MKVFGKSLQEYVAFEKWVLVLIAAVGICRLALSLAGFPISEVKWLSVTVTGILAMVYIAVRVPISGFGTHRHLLPLLVLQSAVGNVIAAGGVLLAMAMGRDNIFSVPEYSGGVDGKTWTHAGAHILFGVLLAPLVFWLVASGLMFIVRKISRPSVPAVAS